ncbi:MAG: CAP domain-containing protein [Candidatus Saccharimonas sp.]|nr:MAG: CAP domain-containing protein [Candidatus Saccharimonas sp.]
MFASWRSGGMAVITYSQVDERYSNQEQRDAARKLVAAGRLGLGLFILGLVALGIKVCEAQSSGANPVDTTVSALLIAFLLFLFVYLPSLGVRSLNGKNIVKLSAVVGMISSIILAPSIIGILCMVRYIKAVAALKHYEPFYEETGSNDDVQVADIEDDQPPTLLRKLLRKRLSSIFAVLYALSMLAATTAAVMAYSQGKEPDANMQGVYFIFAFVFALASGISAIVEIFTAKAGKRLRAVSHILCVFGFGILVLAAMIGVFSQVHPGTTKANAGNTHTTRDKYDEGPPDATEILELVNQERQSKGVSPLAVDERLVASAREKAEDMAVRSYLKHDNPEGVPGTELVFKRTGDLCKYGGENIQFFPGEKVTSRMVVNSWKESKPHYDGMLNGKYLLTGVYVKQGTYAASDGYYSVQHFCQIEQ